MKQHITTESDKARLLGGLIEVTKSLAATWKKNGDPGTQHLIGLAIENMERARELMNPTAAAALPATEVEP